MTSQIVGECTFKVRECCAIFGRRLLGLEKVEVGGRWSAEAAEFVRLQAHAKARAAPAVLRPALRGAYVHRWSGLLAAATSLAFAESLTCLPSPGLSNLDGPGPDIRLVGGRP